jgi:glyoxylase-like metal-dependent hydrolase (beta-lactamase superfamily II)
MISEHLLELQLNLEGIVLTHGHFDHCLGLLELMMNFEVPVYLHPADRSLIENARQSAEHWLRHTVDPVPVPQTELFSKEKISFGECSLTVIETPGHTPGSICLYNAPAAKISGNDGSYPGQRVLFTGDTIFKEGMTRTDFRYSDIMQLHASLAKLQKLPPDTLVLAGHGSPAYLHEAIKNLKQN